MHKIKIITKNGSIIPKRETDGAVGYDIRCNSIKKIFAGNRELPFEKRNQYLQEEHAININAGERMLVGTGLYLSLPYGMEVQIRGRSGLTLKYGIIAALGTIDSDYTGEIGVILINTTPYSFPMKKDDRIAQIVPASVLTDIKFEKVEELPKTIRGISGFGSTGKK